MAAVQQEDGVDWQAEVIDLKRQGLDSKDIAEAVGKHAATVRKVIARAREEGTLAEAPIANGYNAAGSAVTNTRTGEMVTVTARPPIDGQTTVDDFVVTAEIVDERDPLEDFRAEAGEAVGDMPPLTPPEPGETEVVAPVMPGTRQMVLDLGPNAAPVHQATVTFKTERWPSGHFGMGDIVTGTFTARIVDVPAKESYDKASEEFRAKRKDYGALITEIAYEAVDTGE